MATEPAVLGGFAQRAGRPAAVLRCSGRRLKVLLLLDGLEAEGQAETRAKLLQWVALAKRSGAAPQICVLRDTAWLNATTAGCPVRHYDLAKMRSWSGLRQAADLVRWMRSHRFDVLQTMMPDSCTYGPLLGRLAGVPVMVGLRPDAHLSAQPEHLAGRLLLRVSNRLLREVLVSSEAAAEQVMRSEGIPPGRITMLDTARSAAGSAAFGKQTAEEQARVLYERYTALAHDDCDRAAA